MVQFVVAERGTYALILEAGVNKSIKVGKLGKLDIEPGFYIYIGSAFGPGGLKARLRHHLKPATKPHWHIDYLRRFARVIEIWYTDDGRRREQDWVVNVEKLPATLMVHPGFGASDSRNISHLFSTRKRPDFNAFVTIIEKIPNHGRVYLNKIT